MEMQLGAVELKEEPSGGSSIRMRGTGLSRAIGTFWASGEYEHSWDAQRGDAARFVTLYYLSPALCQGAPTSIGNAAAHCPGEQACKRITWFHSSASNSICCFCSAEDTLRTHMLDYRSSYRLYIHCLLLSVQLSCSHDHLSSPAWRRWEQPSASQATEATAARWI